MVQGMKIEGDHIFRAAEGSAGMATLTLVDHADNVAPYLAANIFEILDIRHNSRLVG